MSKRVQPASEEKEGTVVLGWILVRSFDYRPLHFRRPLNLECLSEIFSSNKPRAYRDFWGRETGLKAEQTPATLTPLIALTTQSLEGLCCVYMHMRVFVCASCMSTGVTWALLKVLHGRGVKEGTWSKMLMKLRFLSKILSL